eukprot:4971676-Pyramimonas_sp.AAC.1
MEHRWFSNCGSPISAAHILLKSLHQLQRWREGRFRNVALALATRSVVIEFATGWRMKAGGLQIVKLAFARRTFVLKVNHRLNGR